MAKNITAAKKKNIYQYISYAHVKINLCNQQQGNNLINQQTRTVSYDLIISKELMIIAQISR